MRSSLTDTLTTTPASVGTFFMSCAPRLAEAMGETSVSFLLADQQHGPMSHDTLENVLRAADLNELPVLVRLPRTSADAVNTVLDAGAAGVVVPQLERTETLRRIRDEARYDADRSFALSTRAARFGNVDPESYTESVHEDIAIVPQIETEAGVASVEEIASFDDVTALMIGPSDLSVSLGVSKESEEFAAAIDRIVDAAHEGGCGVGIWVDSPAEIAAYEDRMTFLVYSSDIGMIQSHLSEILDA